MSNLKKFNIFVIITSFAKLLVELFIPLILYDKGFSIREIILFHVLKYLFCTISIPIIYKLGSIISYSKLMLTSSIFFSATYLYLNFLNKTTLSLIILALIFAIYLMLYWIGRHTYALSIIEDKKITDNVSLYSIFTILGGIPATYIGAKILSNFGFLTLTIIVLILMLISIIPLIKIKENSTSNKTKITNIVKSFPIRNYLFTIFDQFRYIANLIFPLFIYFYIKKELGYLGIINIICGIGSVIYIYFLSKKMDKNKKDYLKLSIIFLGIIYIFKISINNSTMFLLITFFEGIFKSALDVITQRNTYAYGKNYSTKEYVIFIEMLNNLTRTIIFIIFYIMNISLKGLLVVCIIFLCITVLIKYDDGKYGYNNTKKAV